MRLRQGCRASNELDRAEIELPERVCPPPSPIVCSMPIINMPTLNFQLVSLNSVNTAAPVPACPVAERFLQFSRITSSANSLFLCLTFVIEHANNPETGNCAVAPSASTSSQPSSRNCSTKHVESFTCFA